MTVHTVETSPRGEGIRGERMRSALMVLPALVPAVFVVAGGVGAAAMQSLGLMPLVGPVRFSADAYTGQAEDLFRALGLSLAIAAVSTVIAAVFGVGTALLIVGGRWCGRILAATSAATVTIPHLIGAATVGLLLADSGVLARVLGVPPELWPSLVGGPWWLAVVAEYAWKESAFIALIVAGTLITRVARFDEAAALLGATRWMRFRFVMLPLALPALAISSTIAFVYTLGSYEVAWLLGRTYPEPLAVMALRLFNSVSLTARPEAAAAAVLTTLVSFLVVGACFWALRKTALWR
ncbi:ABC transporter permease subunit [Cryobacterium sp. PH29-G1]|uniref:ABC transporter permease n=1 Tax=Cryobacterium sp. PH29-G1 TaxID=3046211 RepID=UPI0024BB9D2B|nr:ABC transporter permease subunit [Cryobacterium sp. PH29-G1]MDJ0349931.1 ABC transporter permease subunit [Cryobacterium sp. PH29-G1]